MSFVTATIRYRTNARVNLIYSTEPTTKKWEKRKTKKVKTDKLSSIGKQSVESVELVLKKKREVTVGKNWKKEGIKPGWKTEGVMDDESGESVEPMEEVPLKKRLGENLM